MSVSNKPILMVVASNLELLDRIRSTFVAREPMADVIGVDTGEKALELAIHHPVTAVLADEQLIDMRGSELLGMVKRIRPEVSAMVMASPESFRNLAADGKRSAYFQVEKTADLAALVRHVSSHLFEEDVGFSGILANLELPDILQLLCSREQTTQVRISSERSSGVIVIEKGQVVHAKTNTKEGEEAFFDLFGWKGGSFQLQHIMRASRRTISRPWESLLLEAGRIMDERQENRQVPMAPPVALPATTPEDGTKALDSSKTLGWSTQIHEDPTLSGMPGVLVVGTRTPAPEGKRPDPSASSSQAAVAREALPAGSPRQGAAARVADTPPAKSEPVAAESAPDAVTAPKARLLDQDIRPYTLSAYRPPSAARARRRHRATVAMLSVALMLLGTFWLLVQDLPGLQDYEHIHGYVQDLLRRVHPVAPRGPVLPALDLPVPEEETVSRQDDPISLCEVVVEPLDEFQQSGNVVAVSPDVFSELGLDAQPWVELIAGNGVRMGALAISHGEGKAAVYLRPTMARALGLDAAVSARIQVRRVQFKAAQPAEPELVFHNVRTLAEPFCEYWYAVGLGLSAMRKSNLAPGTYALAKGPLGFQSVQIQVMDRGNPEEIWLSPSVREAIGAHGSNDLILLYPKGADFGLAAPAKSASL